MRPVAFHNVFPEFFRRRLEFKLNSNAVYAAFNLHIDMCYELRVARANAFIWYIGSTHIRLFHIVSSNQEHVKSSYRYDVLNSRRSNDSQN